MQFDSIPVKYVLVLLQSITFYIMTGSFVIVPEFIDNRSEAIDFMSEVIDNGSEVIDFMSEVIDNQSEVLDIRSEVFDKKYNQINSKSGRARHCTHPIAVRHICCLHDANAQNQRHQKNLPARPSPPHKNTAALLLRLLNETM